MKAAKQLNVSGAESIARDATRAALLPYRDHPALAHADLTLGTFFPDKNHYSFSLYIAKERSTEGIVLTTAVVDRLTGQVEVEVFETAFSIVASMETET